MLFRFRTSWAAARVVATVILPCSWLLGGMLVDSAAAQQDSVAQTEADEGKSEAFVDAVLKPFWKQKRIADSFFFIQEKTGELPTGRLLFLPEGPVSVTNMSGDIQFGEGKDFEVDKENGLLKLLPGGRISFKTIEEMYPLMSSDLPKIGKPQGDKERGVFFDNGDGYHRLQVLAHYDVAPDQWRGYRPQYAGEQLSRTTAKLQKREPIKIILSGDSISEGYNASKYTKSPPYCPAYGELVALGLEKHFRTKVDFTNYAVAGWQASTGLKQVAEKKIGEQKPDLVIIAYGMNDVWGKNAEAYGKNIASIIAAIRKESPETEFILVSSMLGNKEWGMPMDQFAIYRSSLKELIGDGIVLADVTATWEELLKRKSFYDLAGNGVNHPNDLGHQIYAQVLLSLLIASEK